MRNDPTVVRGHQRQQTVFALQKFTIPNDKVLLWEIIERNGARHQTVEIPAGKLLEAQVIWEKELYAPFLLSLAAPWALRLGIIELTLASAPDFSYICF